MEAIVGGGDASIAAAERPAVFEEDDAASGCSARGRNASDPLRRHGAKRPAKPQKKPAKKAARRRRRRRPVAKKREEAGANEGKAAVPKRVQEAAGKEGEARPLEPSLAPHQFHIVPSSSRATGR